eukprot:9612210-Alexandrium_andersonii.AAC.1
MAGCVHQVVGAFGGALTSETAAALGETRVHNVVAELVACAWAMVWFLQAGFGCPFELVTDSE